MTSLPAPHARGAVPWLVIAGVLVAALSLRGPIVAPTPVLADIEHDLGVNAATAGLLTSVPVLMFALLTPLAALVIRRAGAEIALMLSLSGVLLGTLVRAVPGFGWMLAGSLVIGASITIGNVVIPVIIRRDVAPERVSLVTAAYTATLNAGSLLTSLATVPLASVVGWNMALLLWGAVTLAGAVLWGVHLGREKRAGRGWGSRDSGEQHDPAARRVSTGTGPLDAASLTGPMPALGMRGGRKERGARHERTMLRRPVVWLLVGAFGAQTFGYYGMSTWLPTLVADTLGVGQAAAGALASIFQGMGIVGAFLVPILARFAPPVVPAAVVCFCWLALSVGLLLAPDAFVIWVAFGAMAHAGGFVVIFTLLVGVARSDAEAAGMSALVQGGGYGIGALGAPLLGAVHEATGGWSAPLMIMAGVAVAYTVLLLSALAAARRATT
ncbi:CynX/NimT family MFS transporter [Micromonospora sp. DT81.3]|uniref:MFS transporter n=1 Tax=Actinomycetes TaxID=1760 RepID=UPI003CECCB64